MSEPVKRKFFFIAEVEVDISTWGPADMPWEQYASDLCMYLDGTLDRMEDPADKVLDAVVYEDQPAIRTLLQPMLDCTADELPGHPLYEPEPTGVQLERNQDAPSVEQIVLAASQALLVLRNMQGFYPAIPSSGDERDALVQQLMQHYQDTGNHQADYERLRDYFEAALACGEMVLPGDEE